MLFGDAPRMSSLHVSTNGASLVHSTAPTQEHLGPGSYFTAHNENIRAGWIKRSFSNRQPMLAGGTRRDRYHHYTAGVLINGAIAQGGSQSNNTPGPGYYNINPPAAAAVIRGRQGKFQPHVSQNASMMSGGGMRSTSSRMLLPSASVKHGILFHGKIDDHSHIGPGHYYNADQNAMIKRSFNSRASPREIARGQRRSGSSRGSIFSPSQSNYSGMYSPRYSSRAVEESPQYIPAGEFDEAHLYETEKEEEHQQHQSADFYSRMEGHSPALRPESSEKKKSGRKPGRMTIMENMVPAMFRKSS